MIFVSTSSVKKNKISDSIICLVENGFKNIELSGGTQYYDGYENDLLQLKEAYDLNFICHNYFPPPKKDFIINLASKDNDLHQKSFKHLEKSIRLSKKLGSKNFGFHAGFYIDFSIEEIGKSISKSALNDKSQCFKTFCDSYGLLEVNDIQLYVENNVVSQKNFENFGENPFMLTDISGYVELSEEINFKLLLDVAHLKVSCTTLNLSFEENLDYLMHRSEYIHLSDNNSYEDQNKTITGDSELMKLLSKYSLKDKIVTLEIYEDIAKIRDAYNLINQL